MIAINDIEQFEGLDPEYVVASFIPSENDILTNMIGAGFINATITSGLRVLLSQISKDFTDHYLQGFYLDYENKLSTLFRLVGFGKNANGTISYHPNVNNLNEITNFIINELKIFKSFRERAKNTFALGTWAYQANNIRSLANSGLNKINHIGVYNASNENENKLLNLKDEKTGRFLEISAIPSMPLVKIYNYSDAVIKARVKVEFMKPKSGPQKRKFLDYFPEPTPSGQIVSVVIPENGSITVDFQNKIRGGTATVEYISDDENWASDVKKFIFYIRGLNPTENAVKAYLNAERIPGNPESSYLRQYWFLLKLMMQESSLIQFGIRGSNYLWDELIRGLPVFGSPAGYGIGQIDNFGKDIPIPANSNHPLYFLNKLKKGGELEYQTIQAEDGITYQVYIGTGGMQYGMKAASDEEVWNWKKNIDAAARVADLKAKDIITTNQKELYAAIKDWNTLHPNDKVVSPPDETYISEDRNGNENFRITYSWVKSSIPKLDIPELNALFSPDQVSTGSKKSFFDARIIKSYNGLGSDGFNYIYLKQEGSAKPIVKIAKTALVNGEKVDYVRLVSLKNV